MDDFYDRLAPLYDLIFLDWDASMEQQAGQLAGIIRERWGTDVRTILDVACGIGTQSIGLARKGFAVTASDLSAGAVERAKVEARHAGRRDRLLGLRHAGRPRPSRAGVRRGDRLPWRKQAMHQTWDLRADESHPCITAQLPNSSDHAIKHDRMTHGSVPAACLGLVQPRRGSPGSYGGAGLHAPEGQRRAASGAAVGISGFPDLGEHAENPLSLSSFLTE